jgi:CubicO group peptidase (beta-lactamase class C family)
LFFASGFSGIYLQSSTHSEEVKTIIHKTDSLVIAQQKHLDEDEKSKILQELFSKSIKKMDKIVDSYTQNNRFNGSIIVAKDGIPIYISNTGYARMEEQTPVDKNTRFQIASVSKQFTAISILKLHEEGWLDIHHPIRTYIPELPYDSVTLQHLLTHEGGFPSYLWIIGNYWHQDTPPTNQELIDLMVKHPVKLRFDPGEKFRYSNTGYMILAAIVERVSGKSFEKYLEENFFKPLHMEHTGAFSAARQTLGPQMAKGYRYYNHSYQGTGLNLMDGALGDKGIYSTTRDLVKWSMALNAGHIINKTLLEEAFKGSGISRHNAIAYGYGFRIYEDPYGHLIFHNGSWSGFRSTLRHYPEDDVTVAILTNNSFKKVGPMARKLSSVVFDDYQAHIVYDMVKQFFESDHQANEILSNLEYSNLWDYEIMSEMMIFTGRDWMAHKVQASMKPLTESFDNLYAMNKEKTHIKSF